MPKQKLTVYSINTLSDVITSVKDFVADRFAHYLDEHQNLRFPHKHSFFHLVYFSKGAGFHSIDFVTFPVQAGQVYFMIPGQVHSWHFNTKPDGFIVNFSQAYIDALVANPNYLEQFNFVSGNAHEQVIDIPVKDRPQIEQLLTTIIEEGNSAKALKDDYTRAALIQLMIYISRYSNKEAGDARSNYNSVLLRNFKKLVEQYYKEKKLTRDYAALLYVTPNHLNALTKDKTGLSAGELIRNRVLLEAKRLLINANMSIAEIAAELNFADNSYFSKYFKKHEGISPDEFRKTIKT